MLVDRLSYAYDPAGNTTSIVDEMPGYPLTGSASDTTTLRRLTEAWSQTGACAAAPSTAVVGGPARTGRASGTT